MKSLLCIFIFAGISIVSTAFAAVEYTPIVDIPRLNGNALSTEQYVQAVYFLAITAAALIAVVKIIYAGVQYMLDGIVTHKEQAKKEIWGAVFGLAIILTAVLVLNTINPHLTTLDIFANAPSLKDISASKDTRTDCEKDADSESCCLSKGGSFYIDSSTEPATNKCELGEVTSTPETGDENTDELNCTEMNGKWDSVEGVCRNPAIQYLPLPVGYEDTDLYTESELTNACTSVYIGSYYNPENQMCATLTQ